MAHILVLVRICLVQRKQFNVTNVASYNFKRFHIFLNASPHVAR